MDIIDANTIGVIYTDTLGVLNGVIRIDITGVMNKDITDEK